MSEIGKLKDVKRTGWQMRNVSNPESVSDHSFRLTMMAYIYAKKLKLDVEKCMKMAITHDISEVHTNDIATRAKESDQVVTNKEKYEIEKKSLLKILDLLPEYKDEIFELWEELENNQTPEANLINDLDQIEMILQALEYKTNKRTEADLEEFFTTSEKRIKTETGKLLWKDIKDRYSEVIQ